MEEKIRLINTDEISCLATSDGLIGEGSYGVVRLGFHGVYGTVAAKCSAMKGGRGERKLVEKTIKREIGHLQKASHENVVRVFGWAQWSGSIAIIMEYLPAGSLKHILLDEDVDLSWYLRLQFCCDIANGIAFLHNISERKRLVHGDIKPDNILLTCHLHCKIADFGGAALRSCTGLITTVTTGTLSGSNTKPVSNQYTPLYAPPEFLKHTSGRFTTKHDTYSFAITMHMILSREQPIGSEALMPIFLEDVKNNGKRLDFESINEQRNGLKGTDKHQLSILELLEEEMIKCWHQNPNERPLMTSVKERLFDRLSECDCSILEKHVDDALKDIEMETASLETSHCVSLERFQPPYFDKLSDDVARSTDEKIKVSTLFSETPENLLSPNLEIPKFPKKPLDWFGLLQKNPDIFEKYPNSCILVQEVPEYVTATELNTHFQYRIKNVELLADGILVAFGSEEDAYHVVQKKEHIIGDTVLNVYRKPVPPVYDDRVLIKGNFTQISRDEIKDILEGCTKVEFTVQKQRESGMFLAVFKESIDITEFKHQLAKLSLTNMKLQILEVRRSDCIKLQNVKKGATVEKIKIAFMNKKLHDGNVTLVTQDESTNTALVYFADYKDAEKVAELSKEQEIKVAKQAVEASIFCPGIKGSVEILPFNIHQFTYEVDADPDIIQFFQNSSDLKRDFYKEIEHLADIEFVHDSLSSSGFVVNIKPRLSSQESQEIEQENFENKCKRHVEKFCDECQVKTRKFAYEDRERVRKEFRWTRDAQIIEVKVKDNETINVFVRWEDRKSKAVKAISSAMKAKAFLDFFEEKCNYMETTEAYKDCEFQILMDCGIVEDTKNLFYDNVSIDVDKERQSVTYAGSRESISSAKHAVETHLKKTDECDLTFLATLQLKFLLDTVSTSSYKIKVVEYLRDQLKQNKIKVSLISEGDSVKLIYCHNRSDQLEKARVKILALIKSQTINCPNGFDELMKDDQWKTLQAEIESSGTHVIYKNHRASVVQLVGLPMSFEYALYQITAYFEKNAETEDKIELSYAQTTFMFDYPGESGVYHGFTELEYFTEPGGILLKGKAHLVKKAKAWSSKAVRNIQTEQKTMEVPGMADYLRDRVGKQFLKTVSKDTACVIQIDSVESDEWNEAAKRGVGMKPFLNPHQETPVKVTVINGDILASDCDVIITTVGSNYDLPESQLSYQVIRKGWNIIDEECKGPQQYKSSNYRVSSGGKMQFRKIIHFVTPDNPQALSNELEKLFDFVNDKLQLSSLAVPIIGTGNAMLPVRSVAQAFNMALEKICKKNPKVLKRIDIVTLDQTLISLFQNQISNANLASSSASLTPKVTSKTNPLSNVPSRKAINERHAVHVYLTSNSSASRQRAWSIICDKAKSKCDKRSIEDDVLETLDEDDLDKIMALEAKHNVTITRPDDSSKTNTLLILGLKSKVKDAHTDAITLLHKYSTAVTYSEYVDWKFYHSQSSIWESFSRLTNVHLEKMYKENQNARITVDTKIKDKPVSISVDFKKMTMKRLDNQATYPIKQFFISNADEIYPSNWNNSKAVQLVSLDNGSKEYSNVLGKIQATQQGVHINVVGIDRVENRRLYTQFKAQKEEVKERMKKAGITNPVTRGLFHGTSSDTCAQIYTSGFDRGFAGKNATLYGRGVYFAVNSEYSHQFTQPNNQGERKMFLAEVVTGEFCQGDSSYIVPPVRPGGQPSDLYDSVVNDDNNPTIFVVFKDASVYPLYIITYTWSNAEES